MSPTPVQLLRRRNFPAGTRDMDEWMDSVTDAIYNMAQNVNPFTHVAAEDQPLSATSAVQKLADDTFSKPGVTEGDLTLTGSSILQAGEIWGWSSAVAVQASAISTGLIPAEAVATETSAPAIPLKYASAGTVGVLIESGLTIIPGELAWLSATTAGRATNVKPSSPHWTQDVGTFFEGPDPVTGLALLRIRMNEPRRGL